MSAHADIGSIQNEIAAACTWAQQATGLMLCVQTFAPWWSSPGGVWLVPSLHLLHRSDFCTSVKRRANDRCQMHCRKDVMRKLTEGVAVVEVTCHAGGMELWVPVWRHRQLMALAQLGQYQSAPFRNNCDLIKFTTEQANDLMIFGRIFQRWLTGIDSVLEQVYQAGETDRPMRIRQFLSKNIKSAPTLADLADHLHLSISRTGHVVRQELGMGFSQARELTRLDRARHLLLETHLKISSVASESGFHDSDYFYRRFRQVFGLTPSEYRLKHASGDGSSA